VLHNQYATTSDQSGPGLAHLIADLLNAGVRFDTISIAHQIPKGALADVQTSEDLERLLAPPLPKSLPVLANIIASITAGAAHLRDMGDTLMTDAVDPMIFGAVVAHPPAKDGDPALVFLITKWDY
jgi:hypothetical protein